MEVKTVPADAADRLVPHTVLAGRATTLKAATIATGGDTLEAVWDFGDGTPSARFTVTDANDVSTRHVYSAPAGTRFSATLTVVNSVSGEAATGTYLVEVSEPSLAAEARIAVAEGLWYLHRSLTRRGDAAGSWNGGCAACDPNGAVTATNILAFERAGYDESADSSNPYSATVALARAWLTRNADNPAVKSADLEQSITKAGANLRAAATTELSSEAARSLLDSQNPAGYWSVSGSDSALATGRAIQALANSFRATVSTIFNVSSRVSVTSSGFLYSRVTRTYNGTLTVTNISGTAIPGPINVVLTNLPSGVTLTNANGTFNGSPYRTAAGGLNPGQSLQIAVSFNNPGNVIITSTPVTYSGTFPPSPVTVGCPASTGTNGVAYSSALVGAGGVQSYFYSISPGNLPNGLTLNSATGAITGQPTANGTFNFTAVLTDGTGLSSGTATASCSITINPPASPLTLACPANSGQVGVAYNSAFVAGGGSSGYTYSLQGGSLPAPLALTPGTGAITGTPTASGLFNFTGLVTDSNNQTQTASCSINVAPAATVAITVTTVPAGLTVIVDGNTLTAPQTFNWVPGSNHTIATTTPQGSGGTRHVFNNWSDAGAISHSITTPADATTYTANFNTEHQLTIAASPANGGTVTPASGTFFPAGSVQNVTATANAGFTFSSWTGDVANTAASETTVTMNGPKTLTANFTNLVPITVTTVPAGLSIIVDGNTVTAPQTFNWVAGSNHTIATTTPQGSGGTRHVFSNWSDAGAIAHSITTPAGATTYTANFNTEHQLTIAASPANGGTVTPASGTFFPAGSVQNVTATATSGFTFSSWTGDVANTAASATTVTMSGPKTLTANFTNLVPITVTTVPAGLSIIVDGNTLTAPQTFNWAAGSNHTIATTSPQGSGGTRFVFNNWSDSGPISHSIVTPSSAATFTANFTTEYQLTTAASPANGGTVSPASGTFVPANSVVNLNANANSGFTFSSWTGGPVVNPSSASTTMTMDGPKSVTANFTAQVAITVTTVPAGLSIIVDGNTLTAPQTFNWVPGSNHTLATTSPQGSGGTRFVFNNWSDLGAISHSIITPSSAATFTASFNTEHQLTIAASPANGGNVTPASGTFFPAGSTQNVTATPSSGFAFNGWTGGVGNAAAPSTTVTMDAPKSLTAAFATLLSASCPSLTQGAVGTAYSSSAGATGGSPAYAFSLQSGTLPPPLTINPSTGLISGTPTTKGTYNFVVQVQDATAPIQQTATANCSILIPNRLPAADSRTVTFNEDQAIGFNLSGSDPDGDGLTFSLVTAPTKGSVTGFGAGNCTGTPSNCLRTVTYNPNSNANGPDSFTFRVNDGVGNSTAATVSITINAVNDPPVLTAKNFNVQANMRIVAGAGTMLAGATDPNDPENTTPSFTLTALTPTSGSVTFAADGSFTYDPPSGTTGNVDFGYTVCDNGTPSSACTNSVGTFVIAGPVIHFVNPAAAVNGDGRLQTPFNSLASATAAMGGNTNQRIFVHTGTTASGANVTLPANGWLVGQGVTGASFDAVMGISPSPLTIPRPSIGGTHPVIQGTVSMNGNNVNVRGLRIQPPAGSVGLQATLTGPFTGQVVGDIPNITTSGASAVNLNNVSGTYNIVAVNASGSFATGINLSNVNPSAGSFTVAGATGLCQTGTTTCSGGTISSATDSSVKLNNARNVTLTRMRFNNSSNFGLSGTSIANLTLNTCLFDGTHGNAVNEGALFVTNWSGTGSITGTEIRGGANDNVRVVNNTGSLNRLTIDNSTIRNNVNTFAVGNHGIRFAHDCAANAAGCGGAVMNLTISNSTFVDHFANHLDIGANGLGQMDVVLTSNSFSTPGNSAVSQPLGGALNFTLDHQADMTFDINSNTLTGSRLTAVNFFTSSAAQSTASMVGRFRGNSIGNTTALSSSFQGSAFNLSHQAGQVTMAITGNVFRNWASNNGVNLIAGSAIAGGAVPVLDLTATGNTVNLSSLNGLQLHGISASMSTSSTGTQANACLDIGGAGALANTLTGASDASMGGFEVRMQQRFTSTVRAPGFAGTTGANLAAYLAGRNLLTGAASASGSINTSVSGGVPCVQP